MFDSQVKVWFQNRRTKHKRSTQEEGDESGDKSTGSPKNSDFEDDGEMMNEDEIDIEEESSEETDNVAWKLFYQK